MSDGVNSVGIARMVAIKDMVRRRGDHVVKDGSVGRNDWQRDIQPPPWSIGC